MGRANNNEDGKAGLLDKMIYISRNVPSHLALYFLCVTPACVITAVLYFTFFCFFSSQHGMTLASWFSGFVTTGILFDQLRNTARINNNKQQQLLCTYS